MGQNRATRIFLAILVLALLIRLPGLFHVAAGDEYAWLRLDYWLNWHPPISILLHALFRLILGNHVWVSKLLVLAVGMANLTLVYFITKRLAGEKPALFAAALMAFAAYPILASLQIDIDGSFLMMFYLITTILFLDYLEQKTAKLLLLTGLSYGLCILTKYPGAFILPILALYHWIKGKNLISTVRISGAILLIGLVIFSIFPIWSLLSGSSSFSDTLAHFSKYTAARDTDITLLAIQYLLSVIWMGPLLLGLLVLGLARPRKSNLLPVIWIAMIFLFYTFLNQDNFKPMERYFTILVAPLSIVIGGYLGRLKFTAKGVVATIIFSLVILASFFALNMKGDMLPFYPKTGYIVRALSPNWSFYLPITGSSGPIGFFINFRIIAVAFIASAAALLAMMVSRLSKKRALFQIALLIFLSVSIAYNIFLTQEYLFSSTSPNVNKVTNEVLDYASNNELAKPIYIFRNAALKYYLDGKYGKVITLDFNIENNQTMIDEVMATHSTLMIVDFPKLNEGSLFWKSIQSCTLLTSFADKGFTMGYVYDCSVINQAQEVSG